MLASKIKMIFSHFFHQGKKYLSWIGMGLGILGIVFIVIKLKNYSSQVDLSNLSLAKWSAFIGLSLLYGIASCSLLPLAWHHLLKYCGMRPNLAWSIRAYGLSQLAKYVPGNIFHLASRQAIGVSDGLPGQPLAKSTILDLILEAISGVFFSILILPSFIPDFSELYAFILFIFSLSLYFFVIRRWWNREIAIAAIIYTFFLTIAALIFYLILIVILPANSLSHYSVLSILGAYVVAWLVGLITPGAPGGAGVRELILYTLMHSWISQSDLLLAIIISRIITILGDCVFYGISVILNKILPSEKFVIPK